MDTKITSIKLRRIALIDALKTSPRPLAAMRILIEAIGESEAFSAVAEAVNSSVPTECGICGIHRDWARKVAPEPCQTLEGQAEIGLYYPIEVILPSDMDLLARAAIKKSLKTRRTALIAAFRNGKRPSDTMNILIKSLGESDAVSAVAEAVNSSSTCDLRINRSHRLWAAENAPSCYQSQDFQNAIGLYYPMEFIHPANMDLIAEAAIKFQCNNQ